MRLRVYLAGGLRTDWQEKVMASAIGADYFNPRTAYLEAKEKGIQEDPIIYVDRDMGWIQQCDVIFCFQEETLPDTVNCAWEMGYGFGLNKTIIFVNQRVIDRYASMVSITSYFYTRNLDEGIEKLKELIKCQGD